GAEYNKKKTGSFGIFAGFSFYPSKNVGGYGDGGAITSNNTKLLNKIRRLHEYGQTKKYRHDSIGVNSRLDPLQAAILRVKLSHLGLWNRARRAHAKYYSELLKDTPGITLPIVYPARPSVFHIYAITTKRRSKLQSYLTERGVTTHIHYPIPLHLQKAFGFLRYKRGDFPNAEKVAREVISLPLYPELTDKQIEYVAKLIQTALRTDLR
ncbi:DegT/DnrJ/EryC1/StrS family aminotransferase, partial [Candidatus Microgenomates bacterium]|nr:DegT/DnrJ/EryC1/StrS family aminotransferase [Candidatus Microgenomates bacterium]